MTEEEQDELLQKLRAFNPDFSQLKKCLQKRNFFRVLGLAYLETRHSNMLAWLLDSDGNHNLGDTFVQSFLTSVLFDGENRDEVEQSIKMQSSGKDTLDLNKLKVKGMNKFAVSREQYFIDSKGKQRYIDLLLISKDKQFPLIICIENKVFSLQHDNQLEAYHEYISHLSGYEGYYKLFFYLTPTAEYIDDCRWCKISYSYVLEALEKCLNLKTIEDEVKIFLTHYYDAIRRDIMNKDEEIIKLCRDLYAANKQIYKTIFDNTIGSDREELACAIEEKLKSYKDSGAIERVYSSGRKSNTEFKFVTTKIKHINSKEPSERNKRVWKSEYRLVYIIYVINESKGGRPQAVSFYGALITCDAENDKMFENTILNICNQHKKEFNLKSNKDIKRTEKQRKSGNSQTKILECKSKLKVEEKIDDEFINKLNAAIDGFMALINTVETIINDEYKKL